MGWGRDYHQPVWFHNTVMASGPPTLNDSADGFLNDTLTNVTDSTETPWEWPRTIPSYVVTGLFVWAAIIVTSHQVSQHGYIRRMVVTPTVSTTTSVIDVVSMLLRHIPLYSVQILAVFALIILCWLFLEKYQLSTFDTSSNTRF